MPAHQCISLRVTKKELRYPESLCMRERRASAFHRLIDGGAAEHVAPVVAKKLDDPSFLSS